METRAWVQAWRRALVAADCPLADPACIPGLARGLAEVTAAAVSTVGDPEAADGVDGALVAASRAGREVARRLLEAHFTSPTVIERAVEGLLKLVAGPEAIRLARLSVAAAAAHADGVQRLTLGQQEAIHQAVLVARARAEQELRDSEARFRALFTEAAIGIAVGDVQGRVLDVNEAFPRMLGYSREEFLARPVEQFTHPDDAQDTWQEYSALVAGKIDSFQVDKPYQHKDGRAVWTHLTVSLVRDQAGAPMLQVAMVEDITERHRLESELVHAASHDPLTGLANRTLFLRKLQEAIQTLPDTGQVGLLFLDIDGFKFVNDSRGHVVGDAVLVAMASRLAAITAEEPTAVLARLGGDEFVVLIAGPTAESDAAALAESLMAAVEAPIEVLDQRPVHVRLSIGLITAPVADAEPTELMRLADLALHAAKDNGRAQIMAHDPSRTRNQLTLFTVGMHLPGLEERDELTLAYQPLVRLDTGELHGMEALIRWTHPELGVIPPGRFIPIAEQTSAIVPIGRWVLQAACRAAVMHQWPAVNINVSVRQLWAPSFVTAVRECLDQTGLPAERLRIEVTESILMHSDEPGPLTALHDLADLGVAIVLDDFGTGYSNLAALRRLPIHELKLASTFLGEPRPPDSPRSRTQPDAADQAIVATVVELAHRLHLIVTAEGVETQAQHDLVRTIGCDVAQGHLFGEPRPVFAPPE